MKSISQHIQETLKMHQDTAKILTDTNEALLKEWDDQATQPFTTTPDEALALARALDYRYAMQEIYQAQQTQQKSISLNLPVHTFQAVRQALVRQGFRTRVTPLCPTTLWVYFRVR